MKLGVFTPVFGGLGLEEMLAQVQGLGLESIELAVGGWPGTAHVQPGEFLAEPEKLDAFRHTLCEHGLTLSALSVHGNPLHPDPETAAAYHRDWRQALELAGRLEVETVITFSGCPGGSAMDRTPNWITATWPTEFLRVLEWQWTERVVPYWQEEARLARTLGLKIALEMHPGFVVYHPPSALRLREAVGDNLGVNFDPSHLYWQGIDPLAAIRALRGAIFHVHAKDTQFFEGNRREKGVLDLTPYDDLAARSWAFRAIGNGHDETHWAQLLSELRLMGYDGAISIEHEDALMSVDEGLRRSVEVLSRIVMREPLPQAWWTQ
ncbi:sugar phosphate isomerase/epimerase [Deinococcus sp. S9]|uniref:sugar phosphate isomerase/epimerase family protein n=1 Tax=Deinococcus sp. S9 TaxID=2545754 RepID=UPI00105562DF|nr:sugar phosphate isomerase/epimerase [Deinococcus sp. S9]TDE84757.1 sugar phosphate isomerase/epimerase [Deinococcus sp. S9]